MIFFYLDYSNCFPPALFPALLPSILNTATQVVLLKLPLLSSKPFPGLFPGGLGLCTFTAGARVQSLVRNWNHACLKGRPTEQKTLPVFLVITWSQSSRPQSGPPDVCTAAPCSLPLCVPGLSCLSPTSLCSSGWCGTPDSGPLQQPREPVPSLQGLLPVHHPCLSASTLGAPPPAPLFSLLHRVTPWIHKITYSSLCLYSSPVRNAGSTIGQEPACQCRRCKRCRFDPWVRKIPWRRARQPTPVFLPGESHGQRSLAGSTPWCCKESDTTEATCKAQYQLE